MAAVSGGAWEALAVDHTKIIIPFGVYFTDKEVVDEATSLAMVAKSNSGSGVTPHPGYISMCLNKNVKTRAPFGTSVEEFRRSQVIYYAYWTVHKSKPHHFQTGTGRPFSPVCLRPSCGQVLATGKTGVPGDETSLSSNTPILGWCECLCCKKCVSESPLVQGEWRACPGCEYRFSHQNTYYMYPVTMNTLE
jgi:hypothetical protein